MSAPIRLGLVGHPVTQSRSPVLHAAAAASVGVEATYALFDVPPAELPTWLAAPPEGLAGFNVTAPHKHAVGAWVARTGPVAQRLGVVNTVCCPGTTDGPGPSGYNTDLFGFACALGEPPDGPAVVLGAGGAARAVVAALHDAGVSDIRIGARRTAQGQALLDHLRVPGSARALSAELIVDAGLVIDAIGPAAADWLARLPFAQTRHQARFMSLSYAPAMRRVLLAARAVDRGAQDGLRMLGWQGIAAFERWTGQRPEPKAVFAALAAATRQV